MNKAVVLVALFILQCFCADISCLDNSGKAVDWWISYKLPKISMSNTYISEGKGFAYMDDVAPRLEIFQSYISDQTSFLGRTLNQVYKNNGIGRIMWNDETPFGKTTSSRAHAKGVLIFNDQTGIFVRHSVPNFPPAANQSYVYPSSGTIYGQSMFCVSLDINGIAQIAAQFLINGPEIYDAFVPTSVKKNDISDLANGVKSTQNVNSSAVSIKTRKGKVLQDFAKTKQSNSDLWEQIIAPTLNRNLIVETWGRPLDPSFCGFRKVENIHEISFSTDITFVETKDHSKWGITSTTQNGIVCIGDINRMVSQRKRGGGATCFSDQTIYNQFNRIVSTVNRC
jgi:deoxyribonuclease-2